MKQFTPQSSNSKVKTYTVKGEQYFLPPIHQPTMGDNVRGFISRWPAGALDRYDSRAHWRYNEKEQSLKLITDKALKIPTIAGKPPLLDIFNKYIEEQLRFVSSECHTVPCKRQLKIYQNVFQCLTEIFITYAPLLMAIRTEYDNYLDWQREEIRKLEPTVATAYQMLHQFEEKISKLRNSEEKDHEELIVARDESKGILDALKTTSSELEQQISKLSEAVALEYEHRRDEGDSKRLVQIQLGDIRSELAISSSIHSRTRANARISLNASLLTIAIAENREALKRVNEVVNDLEAKFINLVPRNDFDKLHKKHVDTTKILRDLEYDVALQRTINMEIRRHYLVLLKQRDYLNLKFCTSRSSCIGTKITLKNCHNFIMRNARRWKELAQTMNIRDLEELIISEMTQVFENKQADEDDVSHNDSPADSEMATILRNSLFRNLKPEMNDQETASRRKTLTQGEVLSLLQDVLADIIHAIKVKEVTETPQEEKSYNLTSAGEDDLP